MSTPPGSGRPDRGFGSVLSNRNFLFLWIAQALTMTVQNGIHFTQMVLVENLTGSTAQVGAVILAFSLPAVVLSAVAGMIVDRFSKKSILVSTNFLRLLTAVGYIIVLRSPSQWFVLPSIYVLTFVNSAIGQFFGPAEAATIPMLVGRERLMPANSLFNLTLTASQIVGLVVMAPLALKLWGVEGSFVLMALFYLVATVLVGLLPQDPVVARVQDGRSAFRRAWTDLKEGWDFVGSHRPVYQALVHLTLMASLMLVMAMIAPGFASRVLGMSTEDAIYIFAPAGIGMLVAGYLVGRWGYHIRREWLVDGGLLAMSLTLGVLSWVGRGQSIFNRPIFKMFPEAMVTVAGAVMVCAFFLGLELGLVSIPAQTTLQEESPPEFRGRVFAVLFTVSNLVAIPPMLFIGNLADRYGIPLVTFVVAVLVLGITVWSIRYTRDTWRGRGEPAAGGHDASGYPISHSTPPPPADPRSSQTPE